jgi:hypothetical protein
MLRKWSFSLLAYCDAIFLPCHLAQFGSEMTSLLCPQKNRIAQPHYVKLVRSSQIRLLIVKICKQYVHY